jgi:hypothetical protein
MDVHVADGERARGRGVGQRAAVDRHPVLPRDRLLLDRGAGVTGFGGLLLLLGMGLGDRLGVLGCVLCENWCAEGEQRHDEKRAGGADQWRAFHERV